MGIELELDERAPERSGAASILQTRVRLFEETPGTRDRILFTEGLALQLETGVTLHAALQSLHAQTDKPSMKAVISAIIETVVGGGKFSEALARHPGLFPSTYINLVATAEGAGFMTEVLDQLKDMDEKQERLRAAIVSALSYPAFLVFFSIGVVLFVLMFVFPKFSAMFVPIYADLPGTTKFLMWASDALRGHPFAILLALALGAALLVAFFRTARGRAWLDRRKLGTPVVRDIYVQIYLTRLMRVMGISLQRGVTVLATLAACREVVPNAEFQAFIARLETEVSEGKGIAAGFAHAHFIPSTVMQMIATGEETGKLGHVMARVADFYDRELTKRLNQLAKLVEPVMLLVMGGVVGLIVSSLILPIFKMSRAVH